MPEARKQRGTVVDARGRRVRPLDPVGLHLLRRHDVIPAAQLKQIALAVDQKWTNRGHFIVFFNVIMWLFVSGGFVGYMLFRSRNSLMDPVPLLILIAQFVLMFGSMIGMWYASRKIRFPYFVPALLKHKRCPSCGYDLQGLAAFSDGAVACPECGCAWLLTAPEVVEFDGAATMAPKRPKKAAMVTMGLLTLALLGGVLFTFLNARSITYRRSRAALNVTTQPAPTAASRPVRNGLEPIHDDE